jgi:hypothetical protein
MGDKLHRANAACDGHHHFENELGYSSIPSFLHEIDIRPAMNGNGPIEDPPFHQSRREQRNQCNAINAAIAVKDTSVAALVSYSCRIHCRGIAANFPYCR